MRKKLFICGFALLVVMMGCSKIEPLKIGSKNFTEQYILAEIIAQLLESSNIPVKRSIPYGDTFFNLEAIKNGNLDLYVEYNGTGLSMLGQPPTSDGDKAFAEVKRLFKPLGLEWLSRLGFANDYVLLMRRDRALSLKISKISDLVNVRPNIKMATGPEFLKRTLDGFPALQRRYGLNHVVPTVISNDKSVIVQALLDGKVDVAEGFSTEGRIEDFKLKVLEDDLALFPIYQASPLVRADALKRYPELQSVLQKLAGRIDINTMRQMNREVELEGHNYKSVAQAFLIKHKLVNKLKDIKNLEELVIVAGILNEPGKSISKALLAARKTFQGRRVRVIKAVDPLQAIISGQARLGILSAEAFFHLTDDFLLVPNNLIEAVGVIGTRMAHIVTLSDSGITSLYEMSKLGIGAKNGASDRSARMILSSIGLLDKMVLVNNDDLNEQVEALKQQQLDGLFLMVPIGHGQLTTIMNQGLFKLISQNQRQEDNNLIPFFRSARIPPYTYEQQPTIIETISTQMVLAGPTPISEIVGDRGPATVISANVQPLPESLTRQLNQELSVGEKLDPTLPAADAIKPQTKPISSPLNPSAIESIVNLLIIMAMVFFLFIFLRADKKS